MTGPRPSDPPVLPAQGVASAPAAPPSPGDAPAITLGDVMEILRRHRTLALGCGLGVAAVVLAALLVRTPLYEAQASLALDRGRRAVDFDPRVQFDTFTGQYEHDLLNTQRNILLSRGVLEAGLKAGGLLLNENYVAVTDAVERLRERVTVIANRDSWDLAIALRDEDPRRAEAGLQAILDAYFARQVGLEKERADHSIAFLETQLAEAKRKVEQGREEQQAFQSAHRLFVLDPDRSHPAQRLAALHSKRVMLTQQVSSLGMLVGQINVIDAIPDPERRLEAMFGLELTSRHPTVVEQLKLFYDLKTQESTLAVKYLDRHPRMIAMREQLSAKRGHLANAVGAVRSGVLADHAKLAAQLPAVDAGIGEVQQELNAYRQDLFTLQTMTQQNRANEQLYEQLLKRIGEERIAQRLDVQQIVLVDAPHAGKSPVNVKTPLALAIAGLLGLLAGVGAPLLVDLLGRGAGGRTRVQDLTGLPVLAEIPFVPDLAPIGSGGGGDDDHPRLAEGFRALRTVLLLRRRGEAGQCLMVTSCEAGDGKSTVASRLAVSMARSGLDVLLVDADLRRPALTGMLGQVCERGLSHLLAGEPEVSPAISTHPNLHFLDAGEAGANAGELLNSHCLPEWLDQCRRAYDHIIIDTPPLLGCADALVVASHADAVLLVARDGATAKASLTRAATLLAPVADRLAGVALIGRRDALVTLGLYRTMDRGPTAASA